MEKVVDLGVRHEAASREALEADLVSSSVVTVDLESDTLSRIALWQSDRECFCYA